MSTVFNKNKVNHLTQPMFFGEEALSMQRYDVVKYPVFEKLTQQQLSFFWRPEEVNLQKDRMDFKKLNEGQQFIFKKNLSYQILLDSVQGRSPNLAFLPLCTIPELEACIETWAFFESIHSRSYTHIIRNLYPHPEEVFDAVLEDDEIMKRAASVTKYYDDLIEAKHDYDAKKISLYELKTKFYLALISVNILEGIRFYVSFACTFAFPEGLKLMEGNAKIISLIARDESVHLAITQNIIKNYKNKEGDEDMIKIMEESEDLVYRMYDDAVNEEKAWAEYLFKDANMIGLSREILEQYIEFMANKRMRTIGLNQVYNQKTNPLSWMDHWLSSKSVQIAPQESENESYLIGAVNKDVDDDSFEGFEL